MPSHIFGHMPPESLQYRPIGSEDCHWVMDALGNMEVANNTSQIPHPLTSEFTAHWVQNWIALARRKEGLRIVGLTKDDCGFGSAAFRKTEYGTAELSFWISPNFWRQGMATKIIKEIIDRAYRRQIRELTAGNFIDNLGSQKLLQNFGFESEPETIWVHSASRNCDVETVRYRLPFKTSP